MQLGKTSRSLVFPYGPLTCLIKFIGKVKETHLHLTAFYFTLSFGVT